MFKLIQMKPKMSNKLFKILVNTETTIPNIKKTHNFTCVFCIFYDRTCAFVFVHLFCLFCSWVSYGCYVNEHFEERFFYYNL